MGGEVGESRRGRKGRGRCERTGPVWDEHIVACVQEGTRPLAHQYAATQPVSGTLWLTTAHPAETDVRWHIGLSVFPV